MAWRHDQKACGSPCANLIRVHRFREKAIEYAASRKFRMRTGLKAARRGRHALQKLHEALRPSESLRSGSTGMRRANAETRTGLLRVLWRESTSTQMVSRSTCRERRRPHDAIAIMSPKASLTGLPVTMEKDGVWRRPRSNGR